MILYEKFIQLDRSTNKNVWVFKAIEFTKKVKGTDARKRNKNLKK
jgi:hypothetical protein